MENQQRRRFLKAVTLTAGAIGVTAPFGAMADNGFTLAVDRTAFAQSVASGDPRATSVMLWTRVSAAQCAAGAQLIPLRVEVALDAAFRRPVAVGVVTAQENDDFCTKVRVTGLRAGTTYFYRFAAIQAQLGRLVSSPIGRTRTAAAAGADVPVKFALLSCNDFVGRYYNSLLALVDEPLDFILHIGDYIYETTGDPTFQTPDPARSVIFTDTDGAIRLGTATAPFFAARSLSNYRELYRTYRADPILQTLHERFAWITLWDDHEFSDDCWQANGTYFDGRRSELDEERKRNAERAYFENMPIDVDDFGDDAPARRAWLAGFERDAVRLRRRDPDAIPVYPDTRIYRQFRFGRHATVVATDYRTFRPDHLIPEDAFPGAIAVDREGLERVLAANGVPYDAVKDGFAPYVDIDQGPFAALKPLLVGVGIAAYAAQGLGADAIEFAQKWIRGKLAVSVVNSFIEQFNATVPPSAQVAVIPDAVAATLDRGLAYFLLGKTTLFNSLGARYLVVKNTFDLFAAARLLELGPSVQNAYGDAQDAWYRTTLAEADTTWKLVTSSVSMTSMILDLTNPALGVPAPLNQRFYLNVDQWDGFPQQRAQYLADVLGTAGNVVLLSGDIHASFATLHQSGVAEFTTPAVSSATFASILSTGDPATAALARQLLPILDQLLAAANPKIRYTQTARNGVTVVEVGADGVHARYLELPSDAVKQSLYADPAAAAALRVEHRLVFDGHTLTTMG